MCYNIHIVFHKKGYVYLFLFFIIYCYKVLIFNKYRIYFQKGNTGMGLWTLIFILLFAGLVAGIVYLTGRIRKFRVFSRLHNVKLRTLAAFILLLTVLSAVWFAMGAINAVIANTSGGVLDFIRSDFFYYRTSQERAVQAILFGHCGAFFYTFISCCRMLLRVSCMGDRLYGPNRKNDRRTAYCAVCGFACGNYL